MMGRTVFAALAGVAMAGALAAPAQAADRRIYSYDAMSVQARQLTGAGLTFTFRKGLLSQRVEQVRATGVPVGVIVRPEGDGRVIRDLDTALGDEAGRGGVYRIDDKAQQGPVMIRAFCPGSTKVWLVIGELDHARDLKVHALGDDPATGRLHLCATMDFAWHGEWKVPNRHQADPVAPNFQPDYGRPGN
ncbi:MAG: hypothetical protein JWP35_3106 [Caulobacter sp.]|nr:hypothetical protein [Caulobacter sp.]